MAAVTVLFTVLFSVLLTFVQTGCLELSFCFCTFLIDVRVLFRFLFNKLDDGDPGPEVGLKRMTTMFSDKHHLVAYQQPDDTSINNAWAMNERAQERCRRVTCTCHVG